MKVLVADKMSLKADEVLRNLGFEVVLGFQSETPIDELIVDADALIVRSATTVTADLMAKAKQLKVIGRAGVGIDNIDTSAAKDLSIAVMNTPLANTISTAEQTLALLFAVARHIPQANESAHQGKWDKSQFTGVELFGKTYGIIGFGNIGKAVACRAIALGMNVLVYDPMTTNEVKGAKKVSLDELCKEADFISLHCVLTEETKHLFNAERFAKLKKGVRFINTARGGLVDSKALVAAINNGTVAGAALDVFENEPTIEPHLIDEPRIILTPHISASTSDAQVNVAVEIANKVADFLMAQAKTV